MLAVELQKPKKIFNVRSWTARPKIKILVLAELPQMTKNKKSYCLS